MTMWWPLDEPVSRTAAFGEDKARPNEFIWRIPEYDDEGNLVSGDPDYYRNDPPPIGHSGRQGQGIGLNTSIKGGLDEAGPAEVVPDFAHMDTPGSWGPERAGHLPDDAPIGDLPEGDINPYPYPGPEQLRKDTHWALGPDRQFHWPDGLEAAERGHNLVTRSGFALENSGTDDNPVPSYKHIGTGARIEPSGDEDAPWQLDSPNYDHENGVPYGTTLHSSPVAAAQAHQDQVESGAQREQELQRQREQYRAPRYEGPAYVDPHVYPDRSRSRGGPRRPGYRAKNIYDALNHAVGTAANQSGPEASWDLLNKGTTYGGDPAHVVHHPSQNGRTLSTGMLDNWVAQQFHDGVANGQIKHVIYHHATPLAWVREDMHHDGSTSRTWVVPDERYSNTSSKRQSAIRSNIRYEGGQMEEPYNPDRGFPQSHHQGRHPDDEYGYMSRSHHAQDTVAKLASAGFHRPGYNTRQTPVFISPTREAEVPAYPGAHYTRVQTHGVYMRPVDGPRGAAWIVGEHENGTNKVTGSKRLDSLDEALAHADRMHQWIRDGAQGEPPAIADRSRSAFMRDIRRRRGPGTNIPTTPAPVLEGQQELPFHASSVASWSNFLREDGV